MTRREEAPVKSSPLEIPVNTRSLTVIRKLKGHGLGGGGAAWVADTTQHTGTQLL